MAAASAVPDGMTHLCSGIASKERHRRVTGRRVAVVHQQRSPETDACLSDIAIGVT